MESVYSTLAVGDLGAHSTPEAVEDLGAHSTPEGMEDLAALSTLEVVALAALSIQAMEHLVAHSTQVATITMEGHSFQQALGRGDITTNITGGENEISRIRKYHVNYYQ